MSLALSELQRVNGAAFRAAHSGGGFSIDRRRSAITYDSVIAVHPHIETRTSNGPPVKTPTVQGSRPDSEPLNRSHLPKPGGLADINGNRVAGYAHALAGREDLDRKYSYGPSLLDSQTQSAQGQEPSPPLVDRYGDKIKRLQADGTIPKLPPRVSRETQAPPPLADPYGDKLEELKANGTIPEPEPRVSREQVSYGNNPASVPSAVDGSTPRGFVADPRLEARHAKGEISDSLYESIIARKKADAASKHAGRDAAQLAQSEEFVVGGQNYGRYEINEEYGNLQEELISNLIIAAAKKQGAGEKPLKENYITVMANTDGPVAHRIRTMAIMKEIPQEQNNTAELVLWRLSEDASVGDELPLVLRRVDDNDGYLYATNVPASLVDQLKSQAGGRVITMFPQGDQDRYELVFQRVRPIPQAA
jgi:hypothetical protein